MLEPDWYPGASLLAPRILNPTSQTGLRRRDQGQRMGCICEFGSGSFLPGSGIHSKLMNNKLDFLWSAAFPAITQIGIEDVDIGSFHHNKIIRNRSSQRTKNVQNGPGTKAQTPEHTEQEGTVSLTKRPGCLPLHFRNLACKQVSAEIWLILYYIILYSILSYYIILYHVISYYILFYSILV